MGQSNNKINRGRSSADLSKKVKYNANNIGDYPTTVAEKVIVPSMRMRLSDALRQMQEEIESGGSQVQSDWNQMDDTQPDYIKNKPNISGGGLQIINSTTDWVSVSTYGVTYSTKEEAAAACGISEEMLDAIVAGEIIGPIRFPIMNEDETDYSVLAYLQGNYFADGGCEVTWGKEQQPDFIRISYDSDAGYEICGLNPE